MSEEKLVKMAVVQLIKFADNFAGIEVHVHVNGKYVKLNYSEDQFIEILRKLQQRDVSHVYIKQSDCKLIIEHAQAALSPKSFYNPSTVVEKKMENLENSAQIIKNVINQMGVTPEAVQLLKTVNSRAMSVLQESPTLFDSISKFKKNCSEQFLQAMLTSFIMSMVIDKFPWKSDQVKEKAAMASLLCDMTLENDDFQILREWERSGSIKPLPDHIRRHPSDIAEKLRQKRGSGMIPSETITIIEQHHELPNGKGFPMGLNAPRFNQLSAIFIVTHNFIELLFEENFDFEKRVEIIAKLQKKYDSKSFEKAMQALISVAS